MNIVLISDTHGLHHQLTIPLGDILLHTGDVSNQGTKAEIDDFLTWFSNQPHPYKIFIAGNHDRYFETSSNEDIMAILPKNIIYLNEDVIEINGLKIWGTPITPTIPNKRWAFNKERGYEIQNHWDLIPDNLDIFLVHGPPKGILDGILSGYDVGCENLLKTVLRRKPKLMVFGHIHESRGMRCIHEIQFVNASSVDRYKTKVFPPIVLEYNKNKFEILSD